MKPKQGQQGDAHCHLCHPSKQLRPAPGVAGEGWAGLMGAGSTRGVSAALSSQDQAEHSLGGSKAFALGGSEQHCQGWELGAAW